MSWDSVELYGEQICRYVQILSGTASEAEINSRLTYTYNPEWTSTSLLMTDFSREDIDAGNIISLSETLSGWLLYRQESGSSTLDYIATLSPATPTCRDYVIGTNRTYKFVVFPSTANTIGQSLESDNITIDFWNWSLTTLIPVSATPNTYTAGNTFLFDLDVETGEIPSETDVTIYKGFSQYSKISKSSTDYLKGNVSCMLGYIDNSDNYIDTITLREQLRSEINNTKYKLLKNRKGDCLLVQTMNFRFKHKDFIESQPLDIVFDWQEIGSIGGISVTD